MNPVIKWMGRIFGLSAGIFSGIVVPNALILGGFCWLSWSHMLAFWAGTKATLVLLQFRSIPLENEVATLLKK